MFMEGFHDFERRKRKHILRNVVVYMLTSTHWCFEGGIQVGNEFQNEISNQDKCWRPGYRLCINRQFTTIRDKSPRLHRFVKIRIKALLSEFLKIRFNVGLMHILNKKL